MGRRATIPVMWLTEELMARGLGRKTAQQYVRVIRDAEGWCAARGTTLKAVKGLQLALYVESKPKTWATRKLLRSAIGHYWAVVHRRQPPLWAIPQLPKPNWGCRALHEDEADRLERAARLRGDHKGLVVLLALYVGLRREEIATLRWSSFRDDGTVRVVGKNGRQRDVDVHPVLAAAVAMARVAGAADGYVFPGRFGGGVNPATVWSWTREVAQAAGLELHGSVPPHRLRHTCLAEINDNTGDLRTTQSIAGHVRIETTVIYTRTTARRRRAAVESLSYGRRPPAEASADVQLAH